MGGGVFVGLVSLTSSPYSSELVVLGMVWSASRVLLCVRRVGTFGFMKVVLLVLFLGFLGVWEFLFLACLCV